MSLMGAMVVLAALVSAPASAAPMLRFLDQRAGAPIAEPPHLWLGLGDHRLRATVDTGSTGVVVSASAIPDLDKRETLGPGELTYSSSGRIERGVWVRMPVSLTGADGTQVFSRPVVVLAVTAIDCTPTARRCAPQVRPEHVAMVGIGFARERDHQSRGVPANNPLLNLEGEAGRLKRGYLLSREGILVGAPEAAGFEVEKLSPDPETHDWTAPTACIRLGQTPEACGHILVDTGVTRMFMTVPPDRLSGLTSGAAGLAAGTPVAIRFDAAGRPLGYDFKAGASGDAVAPSDVVLSGTGVRPTFVNTGLHVLNRFDIGFDADDGWFGYRPRTD